MNPNNRITNESGKPRIGGIPVEQVYRTLALEGMTEEQALRDHPGLVADDLLAVREYVAAEIKTRTQDDLTGRPILAKENLRDGVYYKGRCRNATVARRNANEQCFFYWRKKFDQIYIEAISYPTDALEPSVDVFDVVEELASPKFEIPFDPNVVFTGNPAQLEEYNEEMWHERFRMA